MALPGKGASFSTGVGTIPRRGSSFGQRGIKVSFKVLKSKKLNNLKKYYGRPYKAAVVEVMNNEMKNILKAAKEDTPVFTGRLRKSGRIVKPRSTGKTFLQWEIRFGGIRLAPTGEGVDDKRGVILVDYAQKIHELGGKRGRGKSFLIRNWNKAMRGITGRINRNLRKTLPRVI